MRNSAFVILSFLGLICLAASLVWMPVPEPEAPVPRRGPATVPPPVSDNSKSVDTNLLPANEQNEQSAAPVLADAADSDHRMESSEAAPSQENLPGADPPVKPLGFLQWPRPALAFVITGEQFGYFEPCGCTGNQLGGMSRRAGLFEKIREAGWEVRGLDVGGLSRRTGPQAQLKFETTLTALRQLQYVALALAPEELKLEPGYLLSQHIADSDEALSFLGANLVFFGSKEIGTPLPYTIVESGGQKFGITSIMSDTIRRAVIPDRTEDEAAAADLAWTDPDEAIQEVLKSFEREQVSFRILLSQSTDEEIRKQAEAYPMFDIIVAADGRDGDLRPEMIGPVRMLRVGEKGKTAAVVAVYPEADAAERVRYELVSVSAAHFAESDAMRDLMVEYQSRIRDGQIVTAENAVGHPSGSLFVGAQKCGECHTKAYAVWNETPHAQAFESLNPSHQRHGFERLRGIDRTFDPECLSCHVTGWEPQEFMRFRSGFLNEEFAADADERLLQTLLAGNQCENCHGPGSRHVELVEAGDIEAASPLLRVSLEQAESQVCVKCHDSDNSPDFRFAEYWEKVKHYGKD